MTSARETAKNRKFLCIHYTTVTERFPWKQGTYKYSVSTTIEIITKDYNKKLIRVSIQIIKKASVIEAFWIVII